MGHIHLQGPSTMRTSRNISHGTKQERKWRRRQRLAVAGRVIGRLHAANPTEGPRFYLYVLLLHRTGAKGFEDLVTVRRHNGTAQTFFEQRQGQSGAWEDTTKPDYRRAAQELGFVAEDHEYERVLQYASQCRSPAQLRQLFAHILIHCEVADPTKLFATLKRGVGRRFHAPPKSPR